MCEDPITLQCLQVQQGPQARQAGEQTVSLYTHTPVPSARRNDPHAPPGARNVALLPGRGHSVNTIQPGSIAYSVLLTDNVVEDNVSNYVLK